MRNIIEKQKEVIGFTILFLLVCVDRWMVLNSVSFHIVDSDQTIMWYGAREFLNGHFPEPCFFGQAYNTMVEALLSIPLLVLGIDYYYALPLITSFLALFPFFYVSLFFLRKKKWLESYIFLSLPIFLPIEYGVLSAMPRGFMTGIFCISFCIPMLFEKNRNHHFWLYGFLSGLAYHLNPNSLILVGLIGVFLFLRHYSKKKFYAYCLIGFLGAFLIHFFSERFYKTHPLYIYHQEWKLKFFWSEFFKSFFMLDDFLNYVSPLFWKCGWFFLIGMVAVMVYFLIKKKVSYFMNVTFILFMLFFSFGINKVHDGTNTIYFTVARMFLSYPIIIGVISCWVISQLKYTKKHSFFWVSIVVISVTVFFLKMFLMSSGIEKKFLKKDKLLEVVRIADLEKTCRYIDAFSEKNDVDLIVFLSTTTKFQTIIYGGPCLIENFPFTLQPAVDRRTWRFFEEQNRICKTILFVGVESASMKSNFKNYPEMCYVDGIENAYLLSNNMIATGELFKKLKIYSRYWVMGINFI